MTASKRLVVMVLLVLASCDKKTDPASSEPAAGSAAPAPGAAKAKAEADEGARGESVGGAASASGGIAAGLDEVAGSKPRAGSAAVVSPPGTNTAAPPTTPPPTTPEATPTPAAPPSGSNTAATPPPLTPAGDDTTLKVGDRVMARWTNGSWYPGKIVAISADGKYDVNYDDGDKSRALPAAKVRKKTVTAAKPGGGGGKSSSKSSSDAPCPGPGITRRCNGVCVNIQENSNHCGGCNNKCPSGKTCDGHLFCRDADGNL